MSPERWQKIEHLFHAALERRSAERAAFLDEACAGDIELRRRVEALLGAHEKPGDFLEKPAVALLVVLWAKLVFPKRTAQERGIKLTGAEREIAKTRAEAMANVAEVARDAAGAIVERLGGRSADPSSIAAAVSSIKSLSGAA